MKHVLLVLSALLIFSCSVHKRHYQKGYFISWKKSTPARAKEKQSLAASRKDQNAEHRIELPAVAETKNLPQPAEGLSLVGEKKKNATYKAKAFDANDSCDLLIYRDGSEIRIKVLEITGTTVKYKKCEMIDGPTYIVDKSKLFMVKYTNGTNEVFKTQEPQTTYQPAPGATNGRSYVKKKTSLATTGLVFAILGFYPAVLIGGIVAIVTSLIQLNLIQSDPEHYGGEKKARVAFILGVISVVLWIAIIGLIILAA